MNPLRPERSLPLTSSPPPDWSCWLHAGTHRALSQARSTREFVRRHLWAEEWKRLSEPAPACRVCGRLWTPRTDELHQVLPTAARGSLFEMWVPVCRTHHVALHRLLATSGAATRVGRRTASYDALRLLRRRHRGLTGC